MNTKAYLGLFKYSLDAGDIPQDLYDWVTAKVAERGKMTKRIYYEYIDELERRRLFDTDGTPFNTENSAKTDGTFVYKHPKNPFWHISHAVTSTIFKLLGGYVLGAFGYGVWRVKDRKKLKGIGACITTSNHVGYVDALLTRRALGMRKQYIVSAPHNCKNNFGGWVLKSATILPLPSSFKGSKPFNEMLDYVAARGAAIHFYPEKSLWVRYTKPRPYKEGAFYYAERLNVPVVPMLYCFKKPGPIRKLFGLARVKIKIADPQYVNYELPPRERKTDLRDRVQAAVAELYEEFYGKPLEYLEPLPTEADVPDPVENTECAEPVEEVGTADVAQRQGENEEQNDVSASVDRQDETVRNDEKTE